MLRLLRLKHQNRFRREGQSHHRFPVGVGGLYGCAGKRIHDLRVVAGEIDDDALSLPPIRKHGKGFAGPSRARKEIWPEPFSSLTGETAFAARAGWTIHFWTCSLFLWR